MHTVSRRVLLWGVVGAILATALLLLLRPRPALVDLHRVAPGHFQVTIDADGIARVRHVYTVSAPVGGRLLRTDLVTGDTVVQGETVIATLEPSNPALLDPRALAETREALEAAQASRDLATADLERTRADQSFAAMELDRARELFQAGTVPRRFVDEAQRAARSANAAVAAAEAALDARAHDIARIRARLFTPAAGGSAAAACDCVTLTAPISGRVLNVFEPSETVVLPGTPLVQIGDPGRLEIVADFLSSDAVRIEPGQRALIDEWGGAAALDARVRHVEPVGFTKVSALGIEEQRVNVLFDLASPAAQWRTLGHGYRVTARVVVWEARNALTLPVTALFRDGPRWQVFRVEQGAAWPRTVDIGQQADLRVQIVSGLAAGDLVLVNPPAEVGPGSRVTARVRE